MDRLPPPPLGELPLASRIPIAGHVLDLARGELLTAQGEPEMLRPKVLALLKLLGAHAGEVVSKDELMRRVWPDVVVTEDSLTQAVAEIRRCLGDSQREWLRTVARRGYMLVSSPARQAPRRLPAPDTPLLGREEDMVQLRACLRPGALVTLLGAGGIGKTRLALELAHSLADANEGGVWWCDLAPATDAAQVLPLVAAALGVQASGAGAGQQLIAALESRRGLLVLDNCEHLVDALAPLVQALRAGAPQMAWLATSQAPLKLLAEQAYRLDTLAVPPPGATLDAARRCGALALLEQRAHAADQRFVLGDDSLPLAIDICRRLDGVALALEMAAARLPALGVAGAHTMLVQQLGTLSSDVHGVALRQRSLRATLEWSCALLSPAQRQALESLATFAGPFDAASACEAIGTGDALDTLCALVDHSLVTVANAEPRHYRLLETMRLFALGRLKDSGAAEAAFRRHRLAMAGVSRQVRTSGVQLPDDQLLAHRLPRLSDLEAAFANACQYQDAEAGAVLLDDLRTLDGLRGDFTALPARLNAALPLLAAASPQASARIHGVVAASGWIAVPGLPAAAAAARAVQLWRGQAGASWRMQRSLLLLAAEQARAGDEQAAQAALDEALALAPAAAAPRRRVMALAMAGHVAAFAGDNALALRHMQAALALAQQAGAAGQVDYALSHLNGLALRNGDVAAAREYAARALQRARERHTPQFLTLALLSTMECALAAGDLGAAQTVATETLLSSRGTGMLSIAAEVFADLALRQGEPETACRLIGWLQARAHPPRNATDHYAQATVQALFDQARAALDPAAVQPLAAEGAALAEAQLFALMAPLAEQAAQAAAAPASPASTALSRARARPEAPAARRRSAHR